MEEEGNGSENKNVPEVLTDHLKVAWINFMEEFQESFDLNQLDSVFSQLREFTRQNSTKKKRLECMQKEGESTESNNNENPSSLEKKVFANHLLAKLVFKNLSQVDLLSCRLINSYWNEFSTEILLQRNLSMKFTRRSGSNRFYQKVHHNLRVSNWRTLDMFTQLLRTSKQFPCNKFEFYGGNLGNDDAQRLFTFYGPSITSLKISLANVYFEDDLDKSEDGFSVSMTDSRLLGSIISQQLPNLEDLMLDLRCQENYEWSGYTSLLFPPEEKVELPNLKSLKCGYVFDDDALLRQLLVAATNLKSFDLLYDDFETDGLDNFIETGKVKCITNLWFPLEPERLDKLEEMLNHEPEVSSLNLEHFDKIYENSAGWLEISSLLTKLLDCNKKSLKICDFRSLGFLPQLQLPILENVTKLNLTALRKSTFSRQDIHDHSFSFLPPGATFSKNFPRLKSLSFWFESNKPNDVVWWTKCFPTDEIVPSVKKLSTRCTFMSCFSCPLLWVEKFSKMFPNLEKLSIGKIKDFPSFSKMIWTHYKQLTRLTVEIDLNSRRNAHPALDSSFTGLSPEIYKELETFSPSELESMAEKYMKNQPSLLNLTELRELKIKLEFQNVAKYHHPPILSHVTGNFVFRPLKSLRQVNVDYDPWRQNLNRTLAFQNLEQLTPYKVKIIQ